MATETTTTEAASSRHTRTFFFRDPELDFYVQALPLGYLTYGGAAIGEVLDAVHRIDEQDASSWVRVWADLGARLEAEAGSYLQRGQPASARNTYLRALTYYRTASLLQRYADPAFGEMVARVRRCFERAAPLFDTPIERITIPYEGAELTAYMMRGGADPAPRRTVIMIGGGETFAEELYFWCGAAGVERGYNVLLIDMPGQGSTPFAGLRQRYDVEVPMAAVVDTLLARPDVDPEGLVLFGVSWGGYIVLRAAAHEPRIKAVAASTPIIDVHEWLSDAMSPAQRAAPHLLGSAVGQLAGLLNPAQIVVLEKFFEWQIGQPTVGAVLDEFRRWTVDVSRITCPVLCMLSEGEAPTFKRQTYAAYEALAGVKALRVFTAEEGAEIHTQANNLRLAHHVLFAWLDEVLA